MSEQLRIKQALIPIVFGILLILFMLVIRRQKLQSIGITKYNLKSSIIYSLVLIAIFKILLIAYSLVYLGELRFHIKYSLYGYFIFEFLQAGLIEELVFRGYVSPRMRGVIKNRWLSMIVVDLMFSSIHLINMMSLWGLNLFEAIAETWFRLLYTFLFHFIAQLLYERYNNLVGPIILHGMGNIVALWIIQFN